MAFALLALVNLVRPERQCAERDGSLWRPGAGEDFVVRLVGWRGASHVGIGDWGCWVARGGGMTATVVVALENSPNSLDPRVGTDAAAERIDGLLFDALVRKDEHDRMQSMAGDPMGAAGPAVVGVSSSRDGVRFADGRPLGAQMMWPGRSIPCAMARF